MPFLPLMMLGILAGAFIGLGSLFSVIVRSDATLGFAAAQVGSGLVFSLGLLLVVVAGAELFTGNSLLAMACRTGAAGVRQRSHGNERRRHRPQGGRDRPGQAGAAAWLAFFRGVLCNVLVCLAVWMAIAG